MKYNEDPVALAKANADTAADQAYAYDGLCNSLHTHFDNLRDTLQEYGASEIETLIAEQAYDQFAEKYLAGWKTEWKLP